MIHTTMLIHVNAANEDDKFINENFWMNFLSETEIKTEYWLFSEITGKPEPFYPAWKRNVFRLDFLHLLACLKINPSLLSENHLFSQAVSFERLADFCLETIFILFMFSML